MAALVTQMLDLNKRLQDASLEHDRTLLQQQIEATDALVYELYGLTEEEIKDSRGNRIMFELHFSDLPVPAIIFICGAWITINHSLQEGFQFILGAFFVYTIFVVILMALRGQIR